MKEKMCKLLKIAQEIWAVLPSLPSRERGLKSLKNVSLNCLASSLPSRERGLKSENAGPILNQWCRSPRGSVD